MPKPKDLDLEKVTLNLYRGDFGRIQAAYDAIGGSKAIREIVRKHIRELEERMPTEKVDVRLDAL